MTQPSTRVRLRRGRSTHAVHPRAQRLFTLCGYPTVSRDHWMPDDESVTCRQCTRRMAEEARS